MSEVLKNKMQCFETTPPKGVWEKIASELDEVSSYKNITDKLYNYEATPPTDIFKNIVAVLEEEEPEHKVPVRKLGAFKFAAAAAVLLAIATTAVLFFNNNKNTATQTAGVIKESSSSFIKPLAIEKTTEPDTNTEEEKTDKLQPSADKSLRTTSPVSIASKNIRHADVDFISEESEESNIEVAIPNIKESINELASKFVSNRNYIILPGPNGEPRKISLKLFNAVYGNSLADMASNDIYNTIIENVAWEKKFSDWRNKIVQSGFAPNAANGMDILNLKELIREN